MAHLWMQVDGGQWTVKPLDDWCRLLDYDERDLAPGQRDDRSDRTVAVERVEEPMGSLATSTPIWVLIAGSQAKIRVNGVALIDRFRLLQDRDEIRIRTKRSYFAAKSPPMVIKYRGANPEAREDHPPLCARCERSIEPFIQAVCCSKCLSWHHQSEDEPCWTQSESCAVCSQVTDLNAFEWRPED